MAKKKKNDATGKKAKKSADGLEKTIEKKLKKAVHAAEDLSRNPLIADLVAAGMAAAAAALAQSKAGKQARAQLIDAGEEVARESGRAATTIKLAAIDVARSMLDAFEASAAGAKKGGGGGKA